MNRYPRRATVSMKRGLAAESASAVLGGLEQLYFGGSINTRTNNILAITAADQKEAASGARPRFGA